MGWLKYAIIIGSIAILIKFAPITITLEKHQLPVLSAGTVQKGWGPVRDMFIKNFQERTEKDGAAFAVFHKGQLVVDLWGGYSDRESGRPWQEDTLCVAMSTTKAVVGVVAAILVDRGLLDYERPVVDYWPEFSRHGKDKLTVKQLLSHQAGLQAIDEPITLEIMRDWKVLGRVLEDQKPNWIPGSASRYHTLTFGFLVDQIVRRVDPKHRSVGSFFREEIAEPYNIDFHIGLPMDQWHRMARGTLQNVLDFLLHMVVPSMPSVIWTEAKRRLFGVTVDLGLDVLWRASKNPDFLSFPGDPVIFFNQPEKYTVEIPSANGVGTARGLARILSLFGEGKLANRSLVEKLSIPLIGQNGPIPMDSEIRMLVARGWGFHHEKTPKSDSYLFGHPGYGNQFVWLDLKRDLAFAYLHNHFAHDGNFDRLKEALYSVEHIR